MTVSSSTVTQGTKPFSGSQMSGRSLDVFGARRVAFFELSAITLSTTVGGDLTFDPQANGFDRVPTMVIGTYKWASGDHAYTILSYDPIAKAFKFWDLTDGDSGSGDTLAGTVSVFVIGE